MRLAGLPLRVLAAGLAFLLAGALSAVATQARGLEDDAGAGWVSAQPIPPEGSAESESSSTPIPLGKIGDIEFWAPNRGLLITAGTGETIKPGVWAYNGRRWHELSTVCGGSDGRIAWAGPEEFWTISDGRSGQAANAQGEEPPLQDDTLCHFAGGKVLASYATPAFQSSSYPAMDAAGCITSRDCWFAGGKLSSGSSGSFHLHWNGSNLTAEPYSAESYAVRDMRLYNGHLIESVQLTSSTQQEPPPLHVINPNSVLPTFETLVGLPLYGESGELPLALGALHLSSSESALWGAAGGIVPAPSESESSPAQPTVVRLTNGSWTQLLGPQSSPPGASQFGRDVISSIASEPEGEHAWLALRTPEDAEKTIPTTSAHLARIGADGSISSEDLQTLPSSEEEAAQIGPKGGAARLTCPAAHDCWLATTQGWLFHLTDGQTEAEDNSAAFAGLITERPPDESTVQTSADSIPADTSGLLGEAPSFATVTVSSTSQTATRVAVPLLSHLRSRLVHRYTLELRFHLAATARIRLIARHGKRVVAETAKSVLGAGERRLVLPLNPRRWPNHLQLETSALGPVPTVSGGSPGAQTVSTRMVVLPRGQSFPRAELP